MLRISYTRILLTRMIFILKGANNSWDILKCFQYFPPEFESASYQKSRVDTRNERGTLKNFWGLGA